MAVNKVILVGNVGKDGATLRYTASGTAVVNFSLATTERFKDKDGNKQEKTSWHRVVAWRQLAELCGKFLTQGKQIYLEGKLEYGSYENRDGVKIPTAEIVMDEMRLLGKTGDSPAPQQASPAQSQQQSSGGMDNNQFNPDDDIPFICLPHWREEI